MAIARASISDIQAFSAKISEQGEAVEQAKKLVCGFAEQMQTEAEKKKGKIEDAITHAQAVIAEAEQIAGEIQGEINDIEAQLSVTPSTITITEYDEDGNATTRTEPNPEYQMLMSRLNREISRLNAVQAIIASLEATIAQGEQQLSALEKAIATLGQCSDEIREIATAWQEKADIATEELDGAAEALQSYTEKFLDVTPTTTGTGSTSTGSSRAPREHRDDNGQVYRVGKDLIKNGVYTINGYTYETDEQGRILSASGKLRLKGAERSAIKDTIQSVGRGSEKEGDDRGHIIGDRFDGSNGLENMFPQNSTLNRGKYNKFEKELADAVADGKEVYVKIDLLYGTNTNRPTQVLAIATVDGKQEIRFFDND